MTGADLGAQRPGSILARDAGVPRLGRWREVTPAVQADPANGSLNLAVGLSPPRTRGRSRPTDPKSGRPPDRSHPRIPRGADVRLRRRGVAWREPWRLKPFR